MTTTPFLRQTIKTTLALALCTQTLVAQEFTHKAKVQAVPNSGFYRIPLNPNMAARAQAHWQDVRLFDAQGKEVPYLLKTENPYKIDEDFEAFNMADNTSNDSLQTLLIENPTAKKINRFLLDMSNTETERTVRISGSNNKTNWYSVIDSVPFTLWGKPNESVVRQSIRFPYSNYAFYKIEIKKKNKEALNISQVGFSRDTIRVPTYRKMDGVTFTIKQEGSITRVNATVQPRNIIDQIRFYIREPKQYQRNVVVSTANNVYRSKHYTLSRSKQRNQVKNEGMLVLSSEEHGEVFTQFMLGEIHQNEFSLSIENNNNPPLLIDSIVAYQLNSVLFAELKAGAPYFIYLGDSSLVAPQYDLVYFEKNIPKVLPDAVVEPLLLKSENATGEYTGKNDKYMVWIGMGLLAIFLLFITRNLMKKIEN
jgi:tRNA-binding EMAP/Myf-like protein